MARPENERPDEQRQNRELIDNQRPLNGQPDYEGFGRGAFKPAEYYTPETPVRPDRRPGPNPPPQK